MGEQSMKLTRWLTLAALALSAGQVFAANPAAPAPAALPDAKLPEPAEVRSLAAHQPKVALKGLDDASQAILTALTAAGKVVDLTHEAKYEVADPKVARVTST